MKSRSSQGRQENGEQKRNMRRRLDLSMHKDFTYVPEVFSILGANKNKPSHYLYTYLGYPIELRFNGQWTAVCPHFGIETQFKHGKPNVIRTRLNTWLLDYIKDVVRPLPAVLEIAQRRDCTLGEAQIIFDDRASL